MANTNLTQAPVSLINTIPKKSDTFHIEKNVLVKIYQTRNKGNNSYKTKKPLTGTVCFYCFVYFVTFITSDHALPIV